MENSEIFIALNFCKSTVDLLPCGVMCVCLVAQSCPTLWNTMDWNPPGSSVQGILQARILEWVAIPSSRGSFQSRDRTQVSHIVGRLFTVWATKEFQKKTGMGSLFLLQGKFQLRNQTRVSYIEGDFTTWATQEAPGMCIHPQFVIKKRSNDHRMRSDSFSTMRWVWVRTSFMIPL